MRETNHLRTARKEMNGGGLRYDEGKERVDLLVLATGIVPQTQGLPKAAVLDEFKFVENRQGKTGFYGAGCVRRPAEVSATVQDGTGAALKAFQCVVRSAHHG